VSIVCDYRNRDGGIRTERGLRRVGRLRRLDLTDLHSVASGFNCTENGVPIAVSAGDSSQNCFSPKRDQRS